MQVGQPAPKTFNQAWAKVICPLVSWAWKSVSKKRAGLRIEIEAWPNCYILLVLFIYMFVDLIGIN